MAASPTRLLDPGSGASATVRTVAVQDDGKIVIGGDFTTYTGSYARHHRAAQNYMAAWIALPTPGTVNFFVDSTSPCRATGAIVIGGGFDTISGTSRDRIARLKRQRQSRHQLRSRRGSQRRHFAVIVPARARRIALRARFATFKPGIGAQPASRGLVPTAGPDSTPSIPARYANISVYSG